MIYFALLAIGLVAGVFAGLFGIGGGLVIVPALIYLIKMKPLDAAGTSLAALIPPVGLLGAMEYYRAGHIHIAYAGLIGLGLLIGAFFGARLNLAMTGDVLLKLYGGFLVVVGVKMIFFGQ